MYEITLLVALGTGIIIAIMMLRHSANTLDHREEVDTLKPVYIEELSSAQSSGTSSAGTVMKKGLSDKDFKELFLNSDKSIVEIAKACGYKSKSSVYRRAKKLGLSVKARRA